MDYLKRVGFGVVASWVLLQSARAVVRARRHFSYANKIVLITGGSRGLGLVLARQLVQLGARVAILARNSEGVQRAENELQLLSSTGQVLGLCGDVRCEADVANGIASIQRQWGNVDILFNAAGIIDVGPVDSVTVAEFENAMQVNCWGALRTTLGVLPGMRQQNWGRIVNVASLGGKRAVPHMLPYTASKFALVGLSNGLRAELKRENIFVTTACPGLMRTGSPRNATFRGQHRLEYAWFAIGDALPIVSMSAEKAAEQILSACQGGRGEVFISNTLNLSIYFQAAFPELTRELLEMINRFLPRMGGIGTSAAKGYESESAITRSFVTGLSQRAALRNNEILS